MLSLDAPTVAVLWAHLFAEAVHVRLPWRDDLVLAAIVWLIYIADRVLDGARCTDRGLLRLRHQFAFHHRRPLAAAWLVVLLGVAAMVWSGIDRVLVEAGLGLLAIVILYLYLVHLTPDSLRPDWMKRSLVAVIFSLGTALPAWAQAAHPAALGLPVAAFAVLCFLNCTAIETWERPQSHRAIAVVGAICTLALFALAPLIDDGHLALLACAASALGLALIDVGRDHLPADAVRVLADAALLTAAISFGGW